MTKHKHPVYPTPVPPEPIDPVPPSTLASQLQILCNTHRSSIGLDLWATVQFAIDAATYHVQNMIQCGYFAHTVTDPCGSTPVDLGTWMAKFLPQGIFGGENIAYGYYTADSVFAAFMGSPMHKALIENSILHSSGIYVYDGHWSLVATMYKP